MRLDRRIRRSYYGPTRYEAFLFVAFSGDTTNPRASLERPQGYTGISSGVQLHRGTRSRSAPPKRGHASRQKRKRCRNGPRDGSDDSTRVREDAAPQATELRPTMNTKDDGDNDRHRLACVPVTTPTPPIQDLDSGRVATMEV